MCPIPYYTMLRESKDEKLLRYLRLRLVQYASEHGIKPAARAFGTTVKTVRKWVGRYDGTLESLASHSRAPHHCPHKLSSEEEALIRRLKKKHPRWSAKRLKTQYELHYAPNTIHRVCKEAGLVRQYRRKKTATKRLLRELKRTWSFCQQISIDTKYLNDIPEYWPQMMDHRLPRYQYTARDVTTGLLFLGFADELSLTYATRFAQIIIAHLQACGVDLSTTTWQSDNGSEFIGSWQARHPSAFIRAIEAVPGQTHRPIPVGQWRYQADVETVHGIMEDEFYTIERFRDRPDFLPRATTYVWTFNTVRKNSGKENMTPWQLIQTKLDRPHPLLPLLPAIMLDDTLDMPIVSHAGGDDVPVYPFFPCLSL